MIAINAKIDDTFLGWEDHGIFTFSLGLDYGGSHQGGGLLALGNSKGIHPATGTLIAALLHTVGVDSWEKLKGKSVVALKERDEWNGQVIGLRSFIGDREIIFGDFFKEKSAATPDEA